MMKWLTVFLFVALALLLTACRPAAPDAAATPNLAPSADEAVAVDALYTFFDKLQAGDYQDAAGYYGGSYDVVQGYNPDVAPDDFATLWRNACSINGFSCLKASTVTLSNRPGEGEYVFDVEFQTREGKRFVLGPCCGADETEQPPVSVFPIRVARGNDGRYRVVDLPPYTP